jgi:carbon storage regulator CsrA
MLVLARRHGEKIVLPKLNISIQVVLIKPGLVRIGIVAPPEVDIFRQEVVEDTVLDLPQSQ